MKCPSCSNHLVENAESCPVCGEPVMQSMLPTRQQETPGVAAAGSPTAPVTHSVDGARFVPGTLLAGRYRLIALLGRGGMGEVYRAEDLKLSQQVALKFLPLSLSGDATALARFHREVRVARQIAHPNICRVFDIGEVEGHHFISMEYIDGEDLASLLRRIGHLPAAKATEIARQLCAGLAAAHDNNVLHRDLKPANVMLDGRGKVRITDFGLATLPTEIHTRELTAGTPAYMAPEQFSGGNPTIRSDIYSLGLLLYEIFTGKRAFEARTLNELLLQHQTSTPTNPSAIVKDLDPLAEKIILRCLEKDPQKRPSSALQVAAALPGGDPLAAALAAGETPSPEMVAAAPKEGALRPPLAAAVLGGLIALVAVLLVSSGKTAFYSQVPLTKSPEVLAERAAALCRKLAPQKQPVDDASAFGLDSGYVRIAQQEGWDRIAAGQPLTIFFWYRQSPRYLAPEDQLVVTQKNPAVDVPGMTHVVLDPRGRLVRFHAVPPRVSQPSSSSKPGNADWSLFFTESGLDMKNFSQTDPLWLPPSYADERIAWHGVLADHPDIKIRVEAASYQGTPLYFQIVPPWEQTVRQPEDRMSSRDLAASLILVFAAVAVLIIAALVARRNLRLGRGDRKGAYRVALIIFWSVLSGCLIEAHHTPVLLSEIQIVLKSLANALLYSSFFWLLYIALEPYVRRQWPRLIISWSRLLAGDFRNPMVGRDILIGGIFGLCHTLAIHLGMMLSSGRFVSLDIPTLMGFRSQLSVTLTEEFPSCIIFAHAILFLLLLLYVILRTERRAVIVLFLLYFTVEVLFFARTTSYILAILLIGMTIVVTVARFGLLAMVSHHLFFSLSFFRLITDDFSMWYAQSTFFSLFIILGLAIYGFHTSLAGQPLFRGSLLSD